MRLFVMAAVMATAIAGTAWADGARDAASQTEHAVPVSYADLDLSRADDAAMLLSRLRYAALRACAAEELRNPGLVQKNAVADCRAEALDQAVARINAPELTRLHTAFRIEARATR